MENLRLSIFDTFAYVLPGLVVLFAIILVLDPAINQITDIISIFSNINASAAIAGIAGAYIIGFGVDSLGNWLYKFLGFKLWGPPYIQGSVPILTARALVREYSSENHRYLQTWKVMSTMSHNLSLAMIVLMIATLIQAIMSRSLDWGLLSLFSLVFAAIFLHRAHNFDHMHYRDLAEAVDCLHLQKRAIKDAEMSTTSEKAE